ADVVLVRGLVVRPGAGRSDLGKACSVSEVQVEPDAAAVLPAGAATGSGGCNRERAGGAGEWSRGEAGGECAGSATRDVAGVAQAVSGPGADPGGGLRGLGGGAGRGRAAAVGRAGAAGLEALAMAWTQARRRLGESVVEVFEFASLVTGGELL